MRICSAKPHGWGRSRIPALFLACLGACASHGPAGEIWFRNGSEKESHRIAFETRRLHPKARSVDVKVEGSPGRMRPPTIEAGEATIAYLHHWEPASSSLADDSRATTLLFVFNHVVRTPWRVELPDPNVDVIYFEERSGGSYTSSDPKGWIEVIEADDRHLVADLELEIHTFPCAHAKPHEQLHFGGRFSVER